MKEPTTTDDIIGSQAIQFETLAKMHGAVNFEAEASFALQILKNNNYLAGIAKTNPVSLQMAIVNVAAIGISLNPILKYAYLLPRKGVVCLDVSYMGLVHLAVQSGIIEWVQADIVRKGEEFCLVGIDKAPEHKKNPFGEKTDIVGAYCVAKLASGDFLTTTMGIDEIYEIRARSEAFKKNSGPWITDDGEMIKNTVIKRGYKLWPKVSKRFAKAIDTINAVEGIEFDNGFNVPDFSISKEELEEDFPIPEEDKKHGPRFMINHGTFRGKRLEGSEHNKPADGEERILMAGKVVDEKGSGGLFHIPYRS